MRGKHLPGHHVWLVPLKDSKKPMKKLKTKIKHAVRWRILALQGKARDDNNQFDSIHLHFMKDKKNPVIFDVGAHKGESIQRFRNLFHDAVIHSFEPDSESHAVIESRWKGVPGIVLNNAGISSQTGTLTFHRNLKSSTSGFHAINTDSLWARNRSARHNVSPEEFTSLSYDVPVITIDSYMQDRNIAHIDLLKIDTQGHEDDVFKGARNALNRGAIDIIETELIVGDAYVKALHFHDIESLLLPYGYRFYALDKGGDLLKTPSLSFNAIYVHERLLSRNA